MTDIIPPETVVHYFLDNRQHLDPALLADLVDLVRRARVDGAKESAEQVEHWKAENARNAAHVVDLDAECDAMYADQMRTLDAVANAGAAVEKGHTPKVVLELLEKVLTLHEKKRVNEAPLDGSQQAFDISFKARAFWCAEQRRWVLTYPLSLEYLPTHAHWLGPARTTGVKEIT